MKNAVRDLPLHLSSNHTHTLSYFSIIWFFWELLYSFFGGSSKSIRQSVTNHQIANLVNRRRKNREFQQQVAKKLANFVKRWSEKSWNAIGHKSPQSVTKFANLFLHRDNNIFINDFLPFFLKLRPIFKYASCQLRTPDAF